MKTEGYGFKQWTLLMILALIWGSSFILMKRGLLAYPPDQVAAIRMCVAALCLLPWIAHRFREVPINRWKFVAASGFLGNAIPAFLFAFAQTHVNSSVAGMLNSLTPVFTLLLSFFILKKTSKKVHVIGVLLGLIGALIIIVFRSKGGISGDLNYGLLIALATLCYAGSILIIKTKLGGIPSLPLAGFAVSIGAFPYSIYLLFTDFGKRFTADIANAVNPIELPWLHIPSLGSSSFAAIALLAIMGTAIALLLFNSLIRSSSALFASSVTYLIPLVALFWGFSDHEQLGVYHLIGLLSILSGVYLINRPETS